MGIRLKSIHSRKSDLHYRQLRNTITKVSFKSSNTVHIHVAAIAHFEFYFMIYSHKTVIYTCRRRTGSNAGSSSSPTFSSKQGFPKRIAFSKLRRKSRSLNFITANVLSRSCGNRKKSKDHEKRQKQKLHWGKLFSTIHTILFKSLGSLRF